VSSEDLETTTKTPLVGFTKVTRVGVFDARWDPCVLQRPG
jgi:hypothetical protein